MNTHPLQSFLWGKFREETGIKVVRKDNLQITIHPIPNTPFKIGYAPKGSDITQKMLDGLREIGKKENCIFIQLEPNVEKINNKYYFKNLYPSAHPLFTKFNFILNLTKSEDELLKSMNQKTRYNIRLAQKKGVEVIENNSDKAFEQYLKLTQETTKRQNFYAHNLNYHKIMRKVFKDNLGNKDADFSYHLLLARHEEKVLVAWLLFVMGDTLYYPYGASSSEDRKVMASNLMMWEAIRFGKRLGLKKFDMWGAANVADPSINDPYYGFHRFKQGYGPRHVEYVGSFDFVINQPLYLLYKVVDKIRWAILKIK